MEELLTQLTANYLNEIRFPVLDSGRKCNYLAKLYQFLLADFDDTGMCILLHDNAHLINASIESNI